jgi:hypothetical protein
LAQVEELLEGGELLLEVALEGTAEGALPLT